MSYDNPRIKDFNMATLDVIKVMSEGNPGAVSVLTQFLTEGEKIDPDDFMGGFGPIFGLDTLDCYGPEIWMLYKDVCKENINTTLGMLRAVQLGFLKDTDLKLAINGKKALDIDYYLGKVKEQLPAFDSGD